MSTLVRIFIFVGEVLILFLYEFIHIKKELKEREELKEYLNVVELKQIYWLHEPRKYRFTAIISYSILNIIIMLLPLLIYSNERAFSYNKLIFVGLSSACVIFLTLTYSCLHYKHAFLSVLMAFFFLVFFISIPLLFMILDFSETLDIKETSREIIQDNNQINCIIKSYKSKETNNFQKNYIIYYTDEKGERKEKIIEEKDVKSLEYTDTVSIKEFTTEYTKINPELRNPEKYTETSSVYYISIPKELVYDLTN